MNTWELLRDLPQVAQNLVIASEHNFGDSGTGEEKAAWVHEQALAIVSPASAPNEGHEALIADILPGHINAAVQSLKRSEDAASGWEKPSPKRGKGSKAAPAPLPLP